MVFCRIHVRYESHSMWLKYKAITWISVVNLWGVQILYSFESSIQPLCFTRVPFGDGPLQTKTELFLDWEDCFVRVYVYLQSGAATRATTNSTAIFPLKLKYSNIVQRFASKIDGHEHCLPDFPEYAAFFTKFYCIWTCEYKFSAAQKQCWNMFVGDILLTQSLQCTICNDIEEF